MQAVAEVVHARRRDHDFCSSGCRRYCGRGAVGDGVGDRQAVCGGTVVPVLLLVGKSV